MYIDISVYRMSLLSKVCLHSATSFIEWTGGSLKARKTRTAEVGGQASELLTMNYVPCRNWSQCHPAPSKWLLGPLHIHDLVLAAWPLGLNRRSYRLASPQSLTCVSNSVVLTERLTGIPSCSRNWWKLHHQKQTRFSHSETISSRLLSVLPNIIPKSRHRIPRWFLLTKFCISFEFSQSYYMFRQGKGKIVAMFDSR